MDCTTCYFRERGIMLNIRFEVQEDRYRIPSSSDELRYLERTYP